MSLKTSFFRLTISALFCAFLFVFVETLYADPLIIDHSNTDITLIPQSAIEQAKSTLHIAYGHTSHGSQLTTGMTGLVAFANGGGLELYLPENVFAWNNGGIGGALDLHDYAMGGDVGYYPQWVDNTRAYLDNPANADVNVIVWSWCGQVGDKYKAGTLESEYLVPMSQLEAEYPNVKFVYMTGHVDIWDDATNKAANQMIREFCVNNDKILYDFEDIEHYDPDGNYFEYVNDNCDYYDGGGGNLLGNWATEWQNAHVEGTDWYNCSSAHSQPLNANLKAYAAWWLWAALAGWDSNPGDELGDTDLCPLDPNKNRPGICGCGYAEDSCDPAVLKQTEVFELEEGGTITYNLFGSGLLSLAEVEVNSDEIDAYYPAIEAVISNIEQGGTTLLAISYPEIPDGYSFFKCISDQWSDMSNDMNVAIDFEAAVVKLYLTDGGFGDVDGIADGVIVDPATIARRVATEESTPTSSTSSNFGDGGGSGGCFITSIF